MFTGDKGDISTNEMSEKLSLRCKCMTSSCARGVSLTLGDKLGRNESKSNKLLPLFLELLLTSYVVLFVSISTSCRQVVRSVDVDGKEEGVMGEDVGDKEGGGEEVGVAKMLLDFACCKC